MKGFEVQRIKYGVTFPLQLVVMPDATDTLTVPNVQISASGLWEFRLFGVLATVNFHDTDADLDFPFPLDGADFITPRVGTLTITLSEVLAVGMYIFSFVAERVTPGVFGMLAGGMLGGAAIRIIESTGLLLQVQSEAETTPPPATLPYSVKTVIVPNR